MIYFLDMIDGDYRLPVGKTQGYETLEEVIEQSKKYVNDALPINIYQKIGYTYFSGGVGSYVKIYDKE